MFVKLFRLVCPAPEKGQPEYLHAYRMWISFWLGFAAVVPFVFPMAPAQLGI